MPFPGESQPGHVATVHYTTDDDGIHLYCPDCGWRKAMDDYYPTILELFMTWMDHTREAVSNEV